MLDGPQGRSGRVRKISPPPGFDPRTTQPVASRYTDWAIPAHYIFKCIQFKITNKYILTIIIPRFYLPELCITDIARESKEDKYRWQLIFNDHYCYRVPTMATTVKLVIKAAINVSKPSCKVPAFRQILTRREFSRHVLVTTSRHKFLRKYVQQETGFSKRTEVHTQRQEEATDRL
jgi:hypothetical protein